MSDYVKAFDRTSATTIAEYIEASIVAGILPPIVVLDAEGQGDTAGEIQTAAAARVTAATAARKRF